MAFLEPQRILLSVKPAFMALTLALALLFNLLPWPDAGWTIKTTAIQTATANTGSLPPRVPFMVSPLAHSA